MERVREKIERRGVALFFTPSPEKRTAQKK